MVNLAAKLELSPDASTSDMDVRGDAFYSRTLPQYSNMCSTKRRSTVTTATSTPGPGAPAVFSVTPCTQEQLRARAPLRYGRRILPHRPPGLVGFFLQEARCPALGLHLPSTTRTRTSPDRARPRNLLLLPAALSRRQSDRLQQAGEALLNGVVAAGDAAPLAQDLGVHEPG